MIYDGDQVRKDGFFYGYNAYAWASIVINSFGGILVAVVVKYADIILKTIATTLSIVLSAILSIFIFGFVITQTFLLGAIAVFLGTFMYVKSDSDWISPSFNIPAKFISGKFRYAAVFLILAGLIVFNAHSLIK